ncbi:SusC/RagA family TonB-linked outer membrane protein [Bacteroides sp.]|uniref:SusC/RagA family TonB-linked outer membrane protein n=1 Tax=Bacteroides sp. TaxID=29523 RepID=UPI00258AF416|nr:SusC/RagA family TonB-linked outer membrane protein [Bacteroides sp.]
MNRKFIYIGCTVFAMSLLHTIGMHAQEQNDSLVNVAFGKVAQEDLTHAISTVNTSDLTKKTANNNSLVGLESFIGGYNGSVWGQAPLILVDGVPRSASNVRASEVESVTVLKDAAAVVLYGSRAAKGVVLITTKRGQESPMHIDVRANVGVNVPKSYPKYLDAANYMTMYNEACRNDGIAEKYNASTIYNTVMGTNPYRYPDIDFYSSDYLRKFYTNSDVTGEVYGGNEKTRYYLNFGMNYANSLLKYGESKNAYDMSFNVRGNVDMALASWLKASTNAAMIFDNSYKGRGDFWGAASTLRPNWFSPLLPVDMMDTNVGSIQEYIANSNHLIDGKYLLGGTSADVTNPFSELLAAGYTKEKARKFMFDVAVTADLGRFLEGLSFRTAYSVDYTSYYSEAYAQEYAIYEPTWSNVNGKDVIVGLSKFNDDKSSTSEYVGKSTYDQTMTFSAQFDYARTFNKSHNVAATLLGWGYQTQNSADENNNAIGTDVKGSNYHRTSNVNLGLRTSYNYDHKYYVDFSGAVVHSAKLPEGNRTAFSPSVTLGWRLSKEKFMKNVDFVDDLKITASYANLHQDLDISSYYMYQGYFFYSPNEGWFRWRDDAAGGPTSVSKRGSNPNLSFITRNEFRVGIDASLFNRLLKVNANYFNQKTSGLLTQGSTTLYPSFFNPGNNQSFLPWTNYNEDKRTGFDFSLSANKKIGEFDVTLGFNGMVFASEALTRDEVANEDYLLRAGHALDANYGYVCEGFFQDEADIEKHAKQTFGTVRPGDLKYKDINGDGVINSDDQIDLGKGGWSAAPFTFGLNLTLKYKNFTLFAMGSGQTGAMAFKNNSYYWNKGTSKFSEVVMGRWTEETKETATYPRLSTGNGDNNYRNSTFWTYKNNVFRLSNVQLTYNFPENTFRGTFIHGLSVYCGGSNLLTLSKEREYMEMNLGAPQYRNLYLGFKAAF